MCGRAKGTTSRQDAPVRTRSVRTTFQTPRHLTRRDNRPTPSSSPSTPIVRRFVPWRSDSSTRCSERFHRTTARAVGYHAHTTGDSSSTYGTCSSRGKSSRLKAYSAGNDSGTKRTPSSGAGLGRAMKVVPRRCSEPTAPASASDKKVNPSAAGSPVTSTGTPNAMNRLYGLSSPTYRLASPQKCFSGPRA